MHANFTLASVGVGMVFKQCALTHQELQHKSLLDVVMAVDGRRQALRQQLQDVLALGDLSDVLDVGRRHLHTERAK